jgi:hypothetical protein
MNAAVGNNWSARRDVSLLLAKLCKCGAEMKLYFAAKNKRINTIFL